MRYLVLLTLAAVVTFGSAKLIADHPLETPKRYKNYKEWRKAQERDRQNERESGKDRRDNQREQRREQQRDPKRDKN